MQRTRRRLAPSGISTSSQRTNTYALISFNFAWYVYELLGQVAALQHFPGDAPAHQSWDDHSMPGLVTIAGATWLSESDGFQSFPHFKSEDFEHERRREHDDRGKRPDTVPEPGSMVLFGTGLLGASGLLRQRRRG